MRKIRNEKAKYWFLIALILLVGSLAFNLSSRLVKETPVTNVSCYDGHGSLILDIQCQTQVFPLSFYLASLILAFSILSLVLAIFRLLSYYLGDRN